MIDNELWFIIASGFLDQLLTDIQSITDKNERKLLLEYGVFTAKQIWTGKEPTSVGYVVHPSKIELLYDYIEEAEFNPRYRSDIIPRPQNISVNAGTVSCDDYADHVTTIYKWENEKFTLLGDLASNSSPGAGYYVLAYYNDTDNVIGCPSNFVQV